MKKIIKFPNKILSEKSVQIKNINDNIKNIIKNMEYVMQSNKGLGLAAVQIGIKKNILIIDVSKKKNQILVIINPKIIFKEDNIIYKEGCLSFPNVFVNIKRNKNIKIKFLSLDEKNKIIKINKLLSICIQHEMDHLNGITLYDKVSNSIKKIILKNIK